MVGKWDEDMEKFQTGDWDFERDVLNPFVESRRHPPRERKIGVYYPSGLGYCNRKQFFDFHMNTPVELNVMKIFYVGDVFHEQVLAKPLEWMYGNKIHTEERSITLTIDIPDEDRTIVLRGRIDDHIMFKNKLIVPIEGKSQSGYLSRKKEPSSHHVAQLVPYMIAMGVTVGYLVYMEKTANPRGPGDAITKTFPVFYDYKVWQKLKERIIYLDKCLRANKLPVAEAKVDMDLKWNCRYCAQADLCKRFGPEETEFDQDED